MTRKRGKKETNETGTPATGPIAVTRRQDLISMGLIVVACLAIYYQVAGFDFINLDDDIYVYENAAVAKGVVGEIHRMGV